MPKHQSYIFRFVLIICLAGLTGWVNGVRGQINTLTLSESIALAQEQSPEAKIARQGYEAVYWNYRAYRASLFPQMSLRANTPGLNRSINVILQDDGTQQFIPQNQAFSNANLFITQQIAPTGGTLSLRSGLNRNDIFGNAGFTTYSSTPFLLSLDQPLFAFNELKWEKRRQPLNFERAERAYLESLEGIAVDICGKYFDVYIAQLQLENVRVNEQVNDSIFKISQGRYSVGKIAENDLLQTELAKLNSQVQVQDAILRLEQAQTDLAITLGLASESSFLVTAPDTLGRTEVDVNFAVEYALEKRSDAIDFAIRQLQAEQNIRQAKANTRFNATINASVGLNQAGGTLAEAYTDPLDQQAASVGLSVPILQWGAGKAQVQSALVGQEQVEEQIRLEKQRLRRDVRFQVLGFLQLQDRLTLAKKASDISERRFEVAKNRYLIGKIDITNLQIAQNEKDNAQRSYFEALKQYWVAYYQLRRSTLYDFASNEPLLVPDLSR